MRAIIGAVVVLAFAGVVTGQDKDKDKVDTKKLIGKWEPKEKDPKAAFVMEFTDKGKLVMTVDNGGKVEGTYKVDGNKMEVIIPLGGKDQKETLTIKKLTDDELVTVDSKNKEDAFKKKK